MGGKGAGNQWDMVLILGMTGREGINAKVEGDASRRAEGYCFPCDGCKGEKIQTGRGSCGIKAPELPLSL